MKQRSLCVWLSSVSKTTVTSYFLRFICPAQTLQSFYLQHVNGLTHVFYVNQHINYLRHLEVSRNTRPLTSRQCCKITSISLTCSVIRSNHLLYDVITCIDHDVCFKLDDDQKMTFLYFLIFTSLTISCFRTIGTCVP